MLKLVGRFANFLDSIKYTFEFAQIRINFTT